MARTSAPPGSSPCAAQATPCGRQLSGFGGTNAHVIMEAPSWPAWRNGGRRSPHSGRCALSAKSAGALTALARAPTWSSSQPTRSLASSTRSLLRNFAPLRTSGDRISLFGFAVVGRSGSVARPAAEEFSRGKGSGGKLPSNHEVSGSGTSNAAGLRIGFLFSGRGSSGPQGLNVGSLILSQSSPPWSI